MSRAGHAAFSTTLIYIRAAKAEDPELFGPVFPVLPACLFAGLLSAENYLRLSFAGQNPQQHQALQWAQQDLNARRTAGEALRKEAKRLLYRRAKTPFAAFRMGDSMTSPAPWL